MDNFYDCFLKLAEGNESVETKLFTSSRNIYFYLNATIGSMQMLKTEGRPTTDLHSINPTRFKTLMDAFENASILAKDKVIANNLREIKSDLEDSVLEHYTRFGKH